jgi:hypothetical protein
MQSPTCLFPSCHAATCPAGAGAAVLAFSTTDRASFDALPSWRAKVLEQCPSIAMVLVQNKVDLIDKVRFNRSKHEKGLAVTQHAVRTACCTWVLKQCPSIAMAP